MGLWKRTDEDEKEFARQDLTELTAKADQEKIELVYFDGSGFNLWAKVVPSLAKKRRAHHHSGHAWQIPKRSRVYASIGVKDLNRLFLKERLIQMW